MITSAGPDLMTFLDGPASSPPADWVRAVTSRDADHARIQLLVERAQSARDRAEQSEQRLAALGDALASRASIDQATSIIAGAFNIDSTRAFECLLWVCQQAHRPLPVVAARFVDQANAQRSDLHDRAALVELLSGLTDVPHLRAG